jgi:hypothetical protein
MKIAEVRKHALALEATTEEPHHNYSSFRVRGKIFVTIPPDEEHLHVFVPGEEQDKTVELYPEFAEKLYWGEKALGIRLNLPNAEATVVKRLILVAYEARVAKDAGPKKMRPKAKKP